MSEANQVKRVVICGGRTAGMSMGLMNAMFEMQKHGFVALCADDEIKPSLDNCVMEVKAMPVIDEWPDFKIEDKRPYYRRFEKKRNR